MSVSKQPTAVAVPSLPASPIPLLVDIRTAAQTLGISVFAVRNLCWHQHHCTLLAPVRLGAKYLFSPAKLAEFAAALVAGRIEFPATPTKAKPARRKVGR
jgi:hypothetical protein